MGLLVGLGSVRIGQVFQVADRASRVSEGLSTRRLMSVTGVSTGIAVVRGARGRRWAFTAGDSAPENGAGDRVSGALADADHWEGRCADLLDLSLRAGTLGGRGQLGSGGRLVLGGLLLVGGWLGEEVVEAAREVALEGPQRSLGGLAFGFLARELFLDGGVTLGAGDRDDVQRVVELAVPAAVEPVLGALPRGARDRCGPGLQREA